MKTANKNGYIAYYRVSTDKQGRSGLGLEAQREAVVRLAGKLPIHAEYTEIESGKRADNRPQLAAALAHTKKLKATLLIAKLDRLARNVFFISGLMESGVDFVAADMPQANRLTVHIMAAFAEHEREAISTRTKDALAAAKARGMQLGNPRWQESIANARAAKTMPKTAPEVLKLVEELRAQGATIRAIVVRLNGMGIKTPKGSSWHPSSVHNLLHSDPTPVIQRPAVASKVVELAREQRHAGASLREIANTLNALGHRTASGAHWHASTVNTALKAA